MSLHHELEQERHIINADAASLNAPLTVTPMGALRELQVDIDGNFSRADAERLAHSWNALPARNAQVDAAVRRCSTRSVFVNRREYNAGWNDALEHVRRGIEEAGRA